MIQTWGGSSRCPEALGLHADDLLLVLSQDLETSTSSRASVGLAHVSGNVYLAPTLEDVWLSSEQVLIANLFSHGEVGLDAVASRSLPDAKSLSLLESLATFRSLRWLSSQEVSLDHLELPDSPTREAPVIKAVRRSLLRKHPLLYEVLELSAPSAKTRGTCLQHSNFKHHDIQGETIEECQISAAQIAALRAYGAQAAQTAGSEGLTGCGCAILTEAGLLFSGSEISTAAAVISPLQCALVSLGANGFAASSVVSVAWCGTGHERLALQEYDEALLSALIPGTPMRTVELE